MLFSSDDDNLPDVPTVEVGTPITSSLTSSNQAQRFQQLEELQRDLRSGPCHSRRRESRKSTTSSTADAVAAVSSRSAQQDVWRERDEAAFYELRTLVPHLSPSFACSYSDAVILIAAIRNGGGASSERQSLADKCQSLETEKRQLEQRLERSRAECDALHDDVAAAKVKLKAVQEESRGSATVLAQRREEMRKQLLLEETRSEKLKLRNKKLELENDALKERIRGQLR
jgi:outer membrane murein-binding lipoprotein Lpp